MMTVASSGAGGGGGGAAALVVGLVGAMDCSSRWMSAILPVMADILRPDHIQQRSSSVAGEPPPVLLEGEIAVNLRDEVVYIGKGGVTPPMKITPGGTVSTDAGVYF
jgi:hypothetical protein